MYGLIERLGKGFGFILLEDGRSAFFHFSSYKGFAGALVESKDVVVVGLSSGPRGLQANVVYNYADFIFTHKCKGCGAKLSLGQIVEADGTLKVPYCPVMRCPV